MTWTFNRNYKDLDQVAEFFDAYMAVFRELEAAGEYPYNASFEGRIPGIEGPGEETAVYLLQHTRHMRDYRAKVDAYRADGFEPLDVFPETATRFAGVVHYGWRNGEDGIDEWSDARLLTFQGQRVVLPKGRRTNGFSLSGKVLVKR